MSEPIAINKEQIYANKQKEVLAKLFKILNIIPDDKTSYLDSDHLEEKKEEILKLYEDVWLFYKSYVSRNINLSDIKYMSIIRNILKQHNYELISKKVWIERNKIKVGMQRYFINTKKED